MRSDLATRGRDDELDRLSVRYANNALDASTPEGARDWLELRDEVQAAKHREIDRRFNRGMRVASFTCGMLLTGGCAVVGNVVVLIPGALLLGVAVFDLAPKLVVEVLRQGTGKPGSGD